MIVEREMHLLKECRLLGFGKEHDETVLANEDDEDEEEYPKFSEYCFSLDTTDLLFAMQDLGEKARWPRKFEKGTDCIALRKEISYLLSKGHLKEFLGKVKNKTKDHDRILQRAKSPPPDTMVIGFICGGSDICGTSYSTAKRNAKEAKTEQGDMPIRTSSLTEEKVISFDEDDRNDVQDPHHDGLVITMYIANHFIRRIRIDEGSLVNIIKHEVLKKMGIPDSEIISKSSVLVGFSREVKIYIEGVRDVLEAKEQDVKEISLDAENPDVKILVGSNIPEDIEKDILNFLNGRKATFAWKHENMTSISKNIITHRL
ncbi:hypothetical protein L1987_17387 [Smallanthus sonchifolius]|uniref:Uncharacterized protein n=1 Tax=Smallanthus sonchifolius TaxID=185202 RepID=A0ACB9IZA1_9ASTR|nr:hypothetical protein L1987_17387 [Smallanthus sonchifolius]